MSAGDENWREQLGHEAMWSKTARLYPLKGITVRPGVSLAGGGVSSCVKPELGSSAKGVDVAAGSPMVVESGEAGGSVKTLGKRVDTGGRGGASAICADGMASC